MSINEEQLVSITFKSEQHKREALDQIAKDMDRNCSYILNEAINNYIELYPWQMRQIEKGTAAAEAGKSSKQKEGTRQMVVSNTRFVSAYRIHNNA